MYYKCERKVLYTVIDKTYSSNKSSCFAITSDHIQTDPETLLDQTVLKPLKVPEREMLQNPFQKQSSGGVLYKRRSQKFRKIHRKTSVPETLFNKESIGSLAYVFFCEFCEISKSTFCAEHLQQLLLPFDIRQIQDFSSENRAIRSIQPQALGPIIWLYTLSPLTPALRFASVYQISATKHVAY